jgi:hypothetical protein
MSALMSDVIDGSLNPGVVEAAVNAGAKLLKIVEMQYRYGRIPEHPVPDLLLATGDGPRAD